MAKILFSKKGISGVLTAVIMIVLVMAAAGIVWGIVNSTIKGQLENSKACFGNFNKVTIEPLYTCYDSTNDEVHFSLNIGDIDVDEVLVSISSAGTTGHYTIPNGTPISVPGLGPYPTGSGDVALPSKNAALTYIASGFTEEPDLIQIAPSIDGEFCGSSDSISGIESCLLS